MGRADFVERSFRCSICDTEFKALAGNEAVVADPVCGDCGLRYSPEKRRRLTDERKKTKRRL